MPYDAISTNGKNKGTQKRQLRIILATALGLHSHCRLPSLHSKRHLRSFGFGRPEKGNFRAISLTSLSFSFSLYLLCSSPSLLPSLPLSPMSYPAAHIAKSSSARPSGSVGSFVHRRENSLHLSYCNRDPHKREKKAPFSPCLPMPSLFPACERGKDTLLGPSCFHGRCLIRSRAWMSW